VAVLIFFVLHWQLSVFAQSFFHHRYVSHKQFTLSPFWEKAFYLFTWVAQGSSFLVPRAYAYLHRGHHAYSDTAMDPHSPYYFPSVWRMMVETKDRYMRLVSGEEQPEERFKGDIPTWPLIDRIGDHWLSRLGFVIAYTLFYVKFATSPWLFALLPFHFIMGPMHGAIVNWCGHKYGYRNFTVDDESRNTLPWDFLCAGELFQNNHHGFGASPNFAVRRWEVDPTYVAMVVFDKLGMLKLKVDPAMRMTPLSPKAPMLNAAELATIQAAADKAAARKAAEPVEALAH
jgi:stearoyl-CoA desaturase (delta-9 desaturase)